MSLTPISSRESAKKKFFMNSTYIMSRKWESNVFGLRRPKWLQHISVRPNRREKNFLWTRRTSCLESGNQRFLGSGGRNDFNIYQFGRIGEKKFLMNTRYIVSRKWESNVFGLRRPKWLQNISVRSNRREKNFLWTRRTSCLESGNQRFLGSGGRNDLNIHQFARIGVKKFFMNTRYIVSRKWESNVFGLRRPISL